MSFASSIGPDSRPRTTPIRSASITRLSFSWPMRASAASAFRFERKKKKGTRNESANAVAALATKYQSGAGLG